MFPDLNITIGFSTQNNLSSRLIRWITQSPCSHSFIAFDDSALRMRLIMQAKAWGFELRPLKRWLNKNLVVAEFKPMAQPLEGALLAIAELLGTKFDYRSGIVVLLVSLFVRWTKSRFSLKVNSSPSKLICSEAVIRLLKMADYKAVRDLNPEITSPGALLRVVMGNPDEFELSNRNTTYLSYDRKLRSLLQSLSEKRASL